MTADRTEPNTSDDLLVMSMQADPMPCAVYARDGRLVGCNDAYRQMNCEAFSGLPDTVEPDQIDYADLMRVRAQIMLPPDQVEDYVAERVAELQRGDGEGADRQIAGQGWYRVFKYKMANGFTLTRCVEIGELKAREAELADLNLNLEARVAERTAELTAAQKEIVRKGKLAQLGQLTATVAHEIRNPLSAVRTSAFLARRKFAPECQGLEPLLDRIDNGVTRCEAIISELLDFARSREPNLVVQDFDDWVVKTIREQESLASAGVEVVFEPGMAGELVGFDPDTLARALINFLSNASEALVGKGGDQPTSVTDEPQITVTTARTVRGVELTVRDNGPGIAEGDLERILEPLFTTKGFGVGLGLPAVEKIFEQHGGGLDVANAPDGGAIFTGWFPLKRESLAA